MRVFNKSGIVPFKSICIYPIFVVFCTLIFVNTSSAQIEGLSEPSLRLNSILARYDADLPDIENFNGRITAIERIREAALVVVRHVTEPLTGAETLKPNATSNGAQIRPGAALNLDVERMYADCYSEFTRPLSSNAFSNDDAAMLRHHYQELVNDTYSIIQGYGGKLGDDHSEERRLLTELSLLLSMRHISDLNWSMDELDNLPNWVCQPENLVYAEHFALRVKRPFTTYVIACAKKSNRPDASDHNKAIQFLRSTADDLLFYEDQTPAAIACLETARELSRELDPTLTAYRSICIQIAEVYADDGQLDRAAMELKPLLVEGVLHDQFGVAAIKRLKYLYKAGDYDNLLDEVNGLLSDSRSELYLPQIIYVGWVASRKTSNAEKRVSLETTMLEQYPEHALAADVYFAKAMDSLAKSEYSEADRLLELIEYRFPQSRLLNRVAELRDKLNREQ